jgi:hypothetical protein
MSDDKRLIKQVRSLMNKGVYDPHELFKRVYLTNPVHYSRVREAINYVKTR